MNEINLKELILTSTDNIGDITFINSMRDISIHNEFYFVSFICSNKTAAVQIVTRLEPLRIPSKETETTGRVRINQIPNVESNLILFHDTLEKSTTTLIEGGGTIRFQWARIKRLNFVTTGIPSGEQVVVRVS